MNDGTAAPVTHQPDGSPRVGNIPGLVWAYRFRIDGSSEKLPDTIKVADIDTVDGWVWMHFSQVNARARDFIAGYDHLPMAARKTLLDPNSHLKVDVTEGVVHGVFADLQRDLGGATKMIGKLHFAFDEHLVISMRRQSLHGVDETRRRIDSGAAFPQAVELLADIVGQFATAVEGELHDYAHKLDEIEDRVVAEYSGTDRRQVIPIRRETVRMHRTLLGLRGVLHRLEGSTDPKLPPQTVSTAARLAQRIDSLDHESEILQDRCRVLLEEMNAQVGAQTNARLHILSVFTAILLPPTLVVGVFGMNTKDLPLNQTDGGFFYALLICLASSGAAYYLLKRWGILS